MFRHLSSEPPFGGSTIRILALDIETRPALVYTWSLYQPIIGVDQIIDPGGMFCYASKWLGERKTSFYSDHHDGHEAMLTSLHAELDEADAVLHFNGASFDVPHIQREFMEHGMNPPAPYKQIDLYRVVKKQGRFLSNKLAHVAPQLGLDTKVSHSGFKLWKDCLAGDEAAWRKMRRYNVRDVTLLEDAYNILLPWIPRTMLPNYALETGKECCHRCGSENYQSRGTQPTLTGKYPRFQCKDCGGWWQSSKRVASASVVAL